MSLRIILLILVLIVSTFISSLYQNSIFEEKFQQGEQATNTLRGCEGESLGELQCPENYTLKEAKLKYGRWDITTCPVPENVKSKYQPLNRNTLTLSKMYDIPSDFMGKQVTKFTDTKTNKALTAFDITQHDPLAPTRRGGPIRLPIFKQFELKGTCKPIEVKVKGCENDKIPKVSCPDGFIVDGARMHYGRWDNTICLDKTVNSKTPKKQTEVRIPDQYFGKQSIEWGNATMMSLADNKNNYPNVAKHFEITATCKKPVIN
jgi:hypothetical protein